MQVETLNDVCAKKKKKKNETEANEKKLIITIYREKVKGRHYVYVRISCELAWIWPIILLTSVDQVSRRDRIIFT